MMVIVFLAAATPALLHIQPLPQDRDFSGLSRLSCWLWQFIDALCTGVLEVLAILAWYGVYSYVVEDLPNTSKVGPVGPVGPVGWSYRKSNASMQVIVTAVNTGCLKC